MSAPDAKKRDARTPLSEALESADFWVESFCKAVDHLRFDLRRIKELQRDPNRFARTFLKDWERYVLDDVRNAEDCATSAHRHLSFILNAEQ